MPETLSPPLTLPPPLAALRDGARELLAAIEAREAAFILSRRREAWREFAQPMQTLRQGQAQLQMAHSVRRQH